MLMLYVHLMARALSFSHPVTHLPSSLPGRTRRERKATGDPLPSFPPLGSARDVLTLLSPPCLSHLLALLIRFFAAVT